MIKWQNLQLNIQYKAGDVRRGKTSSGDYWSQLMPFAYGEIVGTQGIDKEPVDVIVGNYLTSKRVYVCQVAKNKGGEDKVMIGFLTLSAAKKAFIKCYGGQISFLKGVKIFSIPKFLKLLKTRRGLSLSAGLFDGDTTNTATWGVIQPLPTGWNTKVENPGDVKLTKEEQKFNTELARRQGPEKAYVEVSQGADINISPPLIYSSNR